ncbi:MAG: hypothetical protein CVV24_00445 [Ignavibacteriae bacterium HGW-Ignavibacteriae-3]|nr:MAG: hypothetical protein CVV24_00445 [Ignavibacteriae bacterium HGW-Ignavibacteriae-3]
MNFPYPDDQLNLANVSDANSRNSFYGPFSSTPQSFFDGSTAPGNYSQWSSVIDSRIAIKSPLEIKLSGTHTADAMKIDADMTVTPGFNAGDLVLQLVVVENVNYQGRNGIVNHKNVMRMISAPAGGKNITSVSQKIASSIQLKSAWIRENLGVVVFVQRTGTKEVIQSEYISYKDMVATGIKEEAENIPADYILYQNYPNPFNPETVISYQLSAPGNVSLKIYDLLGREVATLVNEFQSAGRYNSQFSILNMPAGTQGSQFSSGVYFYVLNAGGKNFYKKMLLQK